MPLLNSFKNYVKPQAAKSQAPSTPSSEKHGEPQLNTPSSQSPRASRPGSLYPTGDFRNSALAEIADIKCDVMVNWLFQQQLEAMWTARGPHEGVILKKSRGNFISCPEELSGERMGIFDAVCALNTRVAMTVNTRVIKLFLKRTEMPYIPLKDGLRLQIVGSLAELPSCQKHHFAAFINELSLLLVWDDEPRNLLKRAKDIEVQLMEMIWESDEPPVLDEKIGTSTTVSEVSPDGSSGKISTDDLHEPPRKIRLQQAVMTALVLMILIAAVGTGWRLIAQEILIDGFMLRVGFAVVVPLQLWLAVFFMQSVVGSLAQMLGPSAQMVENSKFYSGTRPNRLKTRDLPHVTIQCPVYKEGLKAVIEPTIMSVKKAISTYEMQGGTANIFINDDGMQLQSEEEVQAKKDFYDEHNIGWVSRPKHNPRPKDGERQFIRPGKFKKASNMNYAMNVSARVEDRLTTVTRGPEWTAEDENSMYRQFLAEVIEEDEGRTWAEGNIRIGDYILLIDSDTRVPSDCFLDAVSEMEQSPQVGIIQFSSGVMNVTTSYFERGITFFTHLIYTAIAYAVASGDVAPFVGHNAILRWSAIQDVSITEPNEPEKYWSDATVSEDFDMALRLQTRGYVVRFASYTGEGFKEGVSLTVYDELARWEKYAYGCNELIFHPIRYWFVRGPFTKLFRNFIASGMPLPSKLTIMAYIGTYYAIASAWILTVANYFIIGWFNGYLDHYYVDSFKIFFSILVVFTALGNIALAILRYRYDGRSILDSLVENFKWVPLLAIFLGGVSLHVSQAILAHMFSIDMNWGATSKEAEDTTFFKEVPKLIKKFKGTFIFCFLIAGMMVAIACFVPPLWRINAFIAIFPLSNVIVSHFLLPIALNPGLMLFKW